jgi:hypothetical protein
LIATLKDLMSNDYFENSERISDKCAMRYKESFFVKEVNAALYPTPVLLDSDGFKIEILGMYFEGRGGTQNVGDHNGHFIYWRMRPMDGETV